MRISLTFLLGLMNITIAGPEKDPRTQVSDQYKTQEVCKRAVENNILIFRFYPDWFVKPKMLENADNDELVEW